MKPKKTGAFRDEECTCWCENKHELYGGSGYTTVTCEGYSDGKPGGGHFIHIIKCNNCNALSEFVDV